MEMQVENNSALPFSGMEESFNPEWLYSDTASALFYSESGSFNDQAVALLGEAFQKAPAVLQYTFDLIINLIGPEKIFLQGTSRGESRKNKKSYHILVIIEDKANRPYSEYDTIINHISSTAYPLTATVIKRCDLFRKLSEGHVYFSCVCRDRNLIYDNGCHPLPLPEKIPVKAIIAKSKRDFQNAMNKSRSFINGAWYYFINNEKVLAAFLLHQAVEQVYRAILKGLTDHELSSHDLYSLMRHCTFCAPEFGRLFHKDEGEEKRLLAILKRAYIRSRYKDGFDVSISDLEVLFNCTENLQSLAERAFHLRVNETEKVLLNQ